jgi:hypothetical protein
VLRYDARSDADPAIAWALLARPREWPAWAPHIRGAWGLGDPEVELGRRGAARLLGVVPVPAHITAKKPGRSWTWRVGVVDMEHAVEPDAGGGCTVALTLSAPAAVEQALRITYGPIVARLTRHLAAVASRTGAARPRPTRTGSPRG